MAIADYRIQQSDYAGRDVASLDVKPQLTAAQLQAAFDRLVKEIVAPRFNALIDALAAQTGADELGGTVSGMSGATVQELLGELASSKANTASPAFTGVPTGPTPATGTGTAQLATCAFVGNTLSAIGAGDMAKSVYDTGNVGTDIFSYADAAATSGQLECALPADGWTAHGGGYTQTASVTGLAASGFAYIASPSPLCRAGWSSAGVWMADVDAADTAVFFASSLPESALTARILKLKAS